MEKNQQHFVPQMYLRAFACAPRRINVFSLSENKPIRDASIKHQCSSRHFYGDDVRVENAIAQLETGAAPVLRSICETTRVPSAGTLEHLLLIAFVALQSLRTNAVAENTNDMIDKIMHQAYKDGPRATDFDEYFVGYEKPARAAIQPLALMIHGLDDLKAHLICCNDQQRFVTSDNPVFRYNQYCEGIRGMATHGAICRGLQVFLPLSPKVLLLLYDGWVYKVGTRGGRVSSSLPDSDIAALNKLQVASAESNLYFSNWDDREHWQELIHQARRLHVAKPVQVEELPEVGAAQRSSLLHTYERVPNMNLKLSFMNIRRAARRVPLLERAKMYRKDVPMPDMPLPPGWEAVPRKRVFGPALHKDNCRSR